jgi:hypothetical protein
LLLILPYLLIPPRLYQQNLIVMLALEVSHHVLYIRIPQSLVLFGKLNLPLHYLHFDPLGLNEIPAKHWLLLLMFEVVELTIGGVVERKGDLYLLKVLILRVLVCTF